MTRKQKIKELETELRLLNSRFYIIGASGRTLHARHNKNIARYWDIVDELGKLSVKWRIKIILKKLMKRG